MQSEMDHPDDVEPTEHETDTAEREPDQPPDETRNGPPQGEKEVTARESLKRELPIVLLVFVAVILSTGFPFELDQTIPPKIYLYAFLGAGVYAVTSLVFEPKRSRLGALRLGYRLVGALPLAAGVYLFSDAFVADAQSSPSVAGLAFLSGLFVRLTLRRLGDVAERLYGSEEEPQLPYESSQIRMTASANLRRGWQRLAADQVPAEKREQIVEYLQRAGDIVEDEDATAQELTRARNLSEEALRIMGNGENDQTESKNGGDAGS